MTTPTSEPNAAASPEPASEPAAEPAAEQAAEEAAAPPDLDPPDLDLLGRDIGDQDHAIAAAVTSWLAELGVDRSMGRLAELAAWWAGIRGHAQAPPPQHVVPALDGLDPDLDVAAGVRWGVARAEALAADGCDLALLAVDDEPAARLAAADLLGLDPVEASGWPAEQDLDDEVWMDAVLELRDGLRRTAGVRMDLHALLTAIGSGPLAAATGFAVRSAALRVPTMLDGSGAIAAGLLARRTSWSANQWWQVAHVQPGALSAAALRSLQLDPLLQLGIRRQDGTAARLAVPLLVEAATLLR